MNQAWNRWAIFRQFAGGSILSFFLIFYFLCRCFPGVRPVDTAMAVMGGFAILLSLGPGIYLARKEILSQLKRDRMRKGLCQHCGYDLRGSTNQCPECGFYFRPKRAKIPKLIGEQTIVPPNELQSEKNDTNTK
jgi:hypothetical protein